MGKTYNVHWSVDDGYMNHTKRILEIDQDEFGDEATLEEITSFLEDAVAQDFRETVNWESDDMEDVAQEIYDDLQDILRAMLDGEEPGEDVEEEEAHDGSV